jgi:hypothetical protein
MTKVNESQFQEACFQWANANSNRVFSKFAQDWGWESWVQVELASFLNEKLPADFHLQREANIFRGRKRVDLLLNTNYAARFQIPVEIKTQTKLGGLNFIIEVQKDMQKLYASRARNYKDSHCAMVVMVVDQGAVAALNQVTWDGTAQVFFVVPTSDKQFAIGFSWLTDGQWGIWIG